ncbi:mobilization protein [Ralstonia sp. 1138]|uniref:plasmid mobilization protein n=1 Tax=Ralstonia sp. 1138 TaxID=3156423 RepID=UPI0033920032
MSSGTEKRQRAHVVGVRMDDVEHNAIAERARDCGLTMSGYLRACALGRKTRNVTTSRVLDMLVTLGNEQRRIDSRSDRFMGRMVRLSSWMFNTICNPS